jgi:putative chitinase
MLDRKTYFDKVREHPFGGKLTDEQVAGQNAILDVWETWPLNDDLRHLAYMLATTFHETSQRMWPIEEYGKGAGHEYGKPDPQTKQAYYGRGFVQLTWRDNYAKATRELGLEGDDDLEWHAERALDLTIASEVMFSGMWEGWFRSPHKLDLYFSEVDDDPYGAREIINGDKHIIPDWSGGKSIGTLIAGYHNDFLEALEAAEEAEPAPVPTPEPRLPTEPGTVTITITVRASPGIAIVVNAEPIEQ